LFPNQPCSNDKDIHEEFIVKLGKSLLHHRLKVKIKSSINTQMPPAGPTEGAGEE
jgi:hypothetical protein